MKKIHSFVKLMLAATLLAGSLATLGLVHSPSTAKVSALTVQQCFERFDGKGQYPGIADKDIIDWDKYEDSKCDISEGGTCDVNESSQGGIVSCHKTKKASCYALYHGKGQGNGVTNTLTEQEYNRYKRSDCARQNGGPCHENSGSQGFIIHCESPGGNNDDPNNNNDCDEDCTNIGQDFNEDDCTANSEDLDRDNCEVLNTIVIITNVLTGLAAVVIVAMIVWGGIQYSMAGADAAKVQAAKQKIMNALIALLLLVFGFSIIQWLVPGGLL